MIRIISSIRRSPCLWFLQALVLFGLPTGHASVLGCGGFLNDESPVYAPIALNKKTANLEDKETFALLWLMHKDFAKASITQAQSFVPLTLLDENIITASPYDALTGESNSFAAQLRRLLGRAQMAARPKILIGVDGHGTRQSQFQCGIAGSTKGVTHAEFLNAIRDQIAASAFAVKPVDVIFLVDTCFSGLFIESYQKSPLGLPNARVSILTSVDREVTASEYGLRDRLYDLTRGREILNKMGHDPCAGQSDWECFKILGRNAEVGHQGLTTDALQFWSDHLDSIKKLEMNLSARLNLFAAFRPHARHDISDGLRKRMSELNQELMAVSDAQLEELKQQSVGGAAVLVKGEWARRRGILAQSTHLYAESRHFNSAHPGLEQGLASLQTDVREAIDRLPDWTFEQTKIVVEQLILEFKQAQQGKLDSHMEDRIRQAATKASSSSRNLDLFCTEILKFLAEPDGGRRPGEVTSTVYRALTKSITAEVLRRFPRLRDRVAYRTLDLMKSSPCRGTEREWLANVLAPPLEADFLRALEARIPAGWLNPSNDNECAKVWQRVVVVK